MKSGKKYNKLTAVSFQRKGIKTRHHYWLFKCECGKEKILRTDHVSYGETKSCGCLGGGNPRQPIHSMTGTAFYQKWRQMMNRTTWSKSYKYYRGISCCERWNNFENFRDDMFFSYRKHVKDFGKNQTTLDRIDNEKGYSPLNCRWATWKEQAQNKRPRAKLSV